jgi:lipid A disaccharide synthetase
MLVKCQYMSLPNLIAQAPLMPEYLSHGSIHSASARRSVEQITQEMVKLLGDPQYRHLQRQRLRELSSRTAKTGATQSVAQHILTDLQPRLELRRRNRLEMTPVESNNDQRTSSQLPLKKAG